MNRLTIEQLQWVVGEIEAAPPIFSLIKDPTLDLDKYFFLMHIEELILQAADNSRGDS